MYKTKILITNSYSIFYINTCHDDHQPCNATVSVLLGDLQAIIIRILTNSYTVLNNNAHYYTSHTKLLLHIS